MARTPSQMIPLGTPLPRFELPDAHEAMHASETLTCEHGLLVIFLCNHCPFVVHVADELGRLGADYVDRGIGSVGINSNDFNAYPDDAPPHMVTFAKRHAITYPYLIDEFQSVAAQFQAACTPDFFLYNAEGTLVYRGQLDGSRPGNDVPVTGCDLRAAMDALCEGHPIPADQTPSMGCNIKWRAQAGSCSNQ